MPQYFYIPYSNPATFYQVDVPAVAGKNFIHLNEDWYSKQILEWEQSVPYFQKWQQTDTVKLQVLSEFSTIKLELLDCSGEVLKDEDFALKPTSIVGQLWRVYEVSLQLADVPEGEYYLLITVGDSVMQFISEPIQVALKHDNTMLFEYKHSINTLDVIYATGIQFGFRCESVIPPADYAPGVDNKVYNDQILNSVLLSATPFDEFKLWVGPCPAWAAKKLNMIFCHDFVLLDGRQFVRPEGAKLDKSRADRYPMASWSMDIRPASNAFSGIFDPSFDDIVAVAYNINSDTFGTTNALPSTLQINLIERK